MHRNGHRRRQRLLGEARQVNTGLSFARSAPGVVIGTALVEKFIPPEADCETAQRFFRTALPFELLITNLGTRQFSTSGPIRPRAVWGPIVLPQIDREQVLGVVTYGGQLRMTCIGHWPTHDFLENIHETLRHVSR